MTKHTSQIDQMPFRSKSDQEHEVALQTQYHNVAIRAVVAALQASSGSAEQAATEKRMG